MSSFIFITILLSIVIYINSFSAKSGISIPRDLIRRIKNRQQNKDPKSSLSHLKKKYKKPTTDYQELFTNMKIDHFSPDNSETFKMRILVNSKYYKEGGPILFYCGNEGPITDFWDASGYLHTDLAKKFNGLVIFAEHRFFGKSFPHNYPQDHDIKKNKFLTVEQTLSDFIVFLQVFISDQKLPKLTPVIAFGGSYGGMLAAWGRMKFPHVFAGAVASSAPILLFENIDIISNSFFKITTDTYRRYDEKCPNYVRQGFNELFNIRNNTLLLHNEDIIKELNKIFKPCHDIKNAADVKFLENTLENAIIFLAQYNYPYDFDFSGIKIPANPAKVACESMNKTFSKPRPFSHLFSQMADFTLGKYNLMEKSVKENLQRLKAASYVFFNNTGSLACLDIGNEPSESKPDGWEFLACTEMIMPMQSNGVTDMFNPEPWDLQAFTKQCNSVWNAEVRPKWAFDFFGGRNYIKETRDYSNVFYINGKMDPWNAGCPQKSTNPKVSVYLSDSAHHLDLRSPNPNDPESIKEARKIMGELVKTWILEYISQK